MWCSFCQSERKDSCLKHNTNIDNLPKVYPFRGLSQNVAKAKEQGIDVIPLHIGDVMGPISPVVAKAIHSEAVNLAHPELFSGYGSEEGIYEVREVIADYMSGLAGRAILPEEIFINYGIKDELLSIIRLVGKGTKVAVEKPAYPAFETALALAGLSGEWTPQGYMGVHYMGCNAGNGFFPELPLSEDNVGVIILNRPNNPMGVAATYEQLKAVVDWAVENGAIIIYDSAYAAWIDEEGIPQTIMAIPGSELCCVEMISGSKGDALTGLRAGAFIVPQKLTCESGPLYEKWLKMVGFIKNGPGRLNQYALMAAFSDENRSYRAEWLNYSRATGRIAEISLDGMRQRYIGGVGPYLNWEVPMGMTPEEFATMLLFKTGVAVTPSTIFGMDGYVRIHLLGSHGNMSEAMERISDFDLGYIS